MTFMLPGLVSRALGNAVPIGRCIMLVSAVALANAAGSEAQQTVSSGPALIVFRFASVDGFAMYSAYRAGPVLLLTGLMENPHSSYRQAMGGIGIPFAGRSSSLIVTPVVGYTDTGWYVEAYIIPSVDRGHLHFESVLVGAMPLSPSGTPGVFVAPSELLVDLARGFEVGAAYYWSAQGGSRPSHGAGPAIKIAVPRGSVSVELVKGLLNAADQVCITLRSTL